MLHRDVSLPTMEIQRAEGLPTHDTWHSLRRRSSAAC